MIDLFATLFEAIGKIFESLGASASGEKPLPKPRKAANPEPTKP
jgi:hypothetical protein